MSTKLDRLAIWLLNLLKDGKKRTRAQMEEIWDNPDEGDGRGLSIYRLKARIAIIEQSLGIKIVRDGIRRDHIYYINAEDCRKLDSSIGKIAVLNTLAVEPILLDYQDILHRIMIDNIPSGEKYLTDIMRAMRQNYVCEIEYQGFGAEKQTVIMDPHFLRETERRWYSVALNEQKGEFRNYCLDRILSFKRLDRTFKMQISSVEEYFRYSFGAYGDLKEKDAEEIVLKAIDKEVKYMVNCRWHHSQKMIEEGAGYALFSFFLVPTYDFINEILRHTRTVEVISPQSLRREIADAIKEKFYVYHDKDGNYIP